MVFVNYMSRQFNVSDVIEFCKQLSNNSLQNVNNIQIVIWIHVKM